MMKLFSNSTIVVMVVLQVVNVVQAKASKPCGELSRKQCKASAVCGILEDECISTIIGELSIVRDGQNNFAPGKLCTVGGGEGNLAGTDEDKLSVVGGGKNNLIFGDTNVVSGGKRNVMFKDMEDSSFKDLEGSTISGGYESVIESGASFSVVTGGVANTIFPGSKNGAENSVISGGIENAVLAKGGVVTGGDFNGNISEGGTNAVITGGFGNDAKGIGGVVMGGRFGNANGDYSLAFGGHNTYAKNDHSMVINLIDNEPKESKRTLAGRPLSLHGDVKRLLEDEIEACSKEDVTGSVCSTDDGQFLAYAEQFTFQIGNNVDERLMIKKDNIKNLIDVLNED